ncbi:MAG TPA: L-glyceraldehyde 3-phosphate reductase, partial [Epulopiscium sp.]|nr:L-glyceraldehyde 3-phosphate reductase [Candidatus Epulonipiscium sp.]
MVYLANQDRYEKMKYNRCGKSGLLLPAMSLGLWHNFGDKDIFEKSKEMILGSFDLGITHFDLANNYGPSPGSAEETFGKVIQRDLKPYRDEIIVSTKAGYYMWPGPYGEWGSKKSLVASLDQSLKRMQLDYVDIFYHHRPDPNTPLEETVEALVGIVNSGKALYIGISNYKPQEMKRISQLLKERHVHCLINQMKYSMLDRTNEDGIDVADEVGMGSIAFSPLAQGLLTGKYLNEIPKDSRVVSSGVFLTKDAITEKDKKIILKLDQIAKDRGQSLAQMALAWVLRDKKVASVILGASR